MSLPVVQRGIIPVAGGGGIVNATVIPVGIQAWPDDPGGVELNPFAMLTGDTLVAFLSWNSFGNPLISFTWNGLALTLREQVAQVVNEHTILGIWTLTVPANATSALTALMSVTTDGLISAMIVRGAPVAFDVGNTAIGNSNAPASANANTTHANEIAFGAVTTDGPATDAAGAWSNGFTAVHRLDVSGQASTHTQSTAYKVLTVAGAVSAAKTGVTARPWCAAVATLSDP